ncbi:hypothetical protein DSECCO2_623920 [anaerobic digester metagenome]
MRAQGAVLVAQAAQVDQAFESGLGRGVPHGHGGPLVAVLEVFDPREHGMHQVVGREAPAQGLGQGRAVQGVGAGQFDVRVRGEGPAAQLVGVAPHGPDTPAALQQRRNEAASDVARGPEDGDGAVVIHAGSPGCACAGSRILLRVRAFTRTLKPRMSFDSNVTIFER